MNYLKINIFLHALKTLAARASLPAVNDDLNTKYILFR